MTESNDENVTFSESFEAGARGTRIFVRRWSPADSDPKAELVVFHGYAEHGERYRMLAHHLATRGIATTAGDFRGHGVSNGQRGHVVRFEDYLDDARVMLKSVKGDAPCFVLGHSQGGLIALDLVTAISGPDLAGLVVTNPFLALAMEVPPAKLWLSEKLANFIPRLPVPSGLPATGLSHDPAVVSAYERDPRVFSTATPGWLSEVGVAQQRVRDLDRVYLPLLYVYSDADPVASPEANRRLAEQLVGDDKTVLLRSGELHEVLNEVDRQSLYETVADWVLARVG